MAILVAGALHLDVIVAAPHLPRPDETVVGSAVTYAPGGKGHNQAVAAARMGALVTMAGAVGDDDFGDRLLASLDRAGVSRSQLQRLPGASGMSVAIVDAVGDYGAVIVSAANRSFDTGPLTVPPATGWVLLQNEWPEAANLAVARAAHAAGARVILNAAPARACDPALLALTDILIGNRVEGADLLSLPALPDPATAAATLARLGPPVVILTLGADGLILHDGAPRHLPAPKVQVVSTHGAGDAFIGALAAALDRGDNLPAACQFAQAAAALHVSTAPNRRDRIAPDLVYKLSADPKG